MIFAIGCTEEATIVQDSDTTTDSSGSTDDTTDSSDSDATDTTDSTDSDATDTSSDSDATDTTDSGDADATDTTDDTDATDTVTDEDSVIDLGELVVETSWITGETGNRTTFDAVDVVDEDWMFINESGNLVMTCLAGDSHRTELKEDSGDEKPLSVYKKMEYKSKLYNVPSHGVTIAQVHNRQKIDGDGVNRPWIRVYVDDDNYIKIKATETTPNADSSTYYTFDSGLFYTSGDDLHIVVEIENGSAYFYIGVNDASNDVTLTPSADWDDYSEGYYLKAGVYTEGEDVEPIMEFSSFSVEY